MRVYNIKDEGKNPPILYTGNYIQVARKRNREKGNILQL